MNEKQLIREVLKGDTSAFTHFVDTYQDMAITIAYRVCENRQDAEDIVQNSFVKAFHNLHTFRTDSKFSTWFYRIVYNTALTHIGSVRFNTSLVDYKDMNTEYSFSDWDTLEKIDEKERKEIIDQAINKLPKDEALLLILYYLEENSVKDIYLITGFTEANIKVKLHRGRKHLGELLRDKIQYAKL